MIGSDFFVDIWFGSSPIPPLADISSTRDTLLIIRGSSMMETGKNLDPLYIIQYSLDHWYFFRGVFSYEKVKLLYDFDLLLSPLFFAVYLIGSEWIYDFGSSPIHSRLYMFQRHIINGGGGGDAKKLDPLYIIQYSLDQWYFFLGVSSYVRDSKLVLWFFELLPSPLVCCKLHRDIIQGGGGSNSTWQQQKKDFVLLYKSQG
jgi:hypothetical protein